MSKRLTGHANSRLRTAKQSQVMSKQSFGRPNTLLGIKE
jgi:hypothetical protein